MGTISITEMGTHSIITFPILSASTSMFIGTCTIESGKTIESSKAPSIVAVSVASPTEALIHFQSGQQEPITGIVSLALEGISKNGVIRTEPIGMNTIDGIGHPTRSFYCAKVSSKERNAGLGDVAKGYEIDGVTLNQDESSNPNTQGRKENPIDRISQNRKLHNKGNFHPTVKPLKLMRYLCRLVTPPNGVVLDPFTGSGSTGVAAIQEGFEFIGIERENEYVEIARKRIEHHQRC